MKQAFLLSMWMISGLLYDGKICPAPIRSYDAKAIRLPDGTSMNRANHILLGWAETRNTNVIDPATNEDAYAQIIYMPGSSYPIQDKDVTLYAV